MREPVSRREMLCVTAMGSVTSLAGCAGLLGEEQGIRDTDEDGVIDSEDYAPRDPAVQERSDIEGAEQESPDGGTPGAETTPADGSGRSVLVDGFESGSLENHWEIRQRESDASARVVSSQAYRGSRSLRIHIGETGRGDYSLRSDFGTAVGNGHVFSCWCYPTGTNAKLVYDLRSADNPSENRVTVRLSPFGDVRYSSPRTDGARVLHESYAADRWQRLRIELRPENAEAVVGFGRDGDGTLATERVQAPRQYDSLRIFAGDYSGNVDVYLDEVTYGPGE